MFIEIIGYLGAILFALCALPQCIQCYQQGHGRGVNPWFIGMWLGGEVLTMVYVYYTHGLDLPLFLNYGTNCLFIGVIIYYMKGGNT